MSDKMLADGSFEHRVTVMLRDVTENPDQVLTILEVLADLCHDSNLECQSAWQEKAAGLPWAILAKHLGQAHAHATDELKRRTAWGGK